MKKQNITEQQLEKSPSGGALVGKRQGQTIIHDNGTMGGYLVGRLHKDNGIKAINKSTGQPLEMQGGEVVITAPAVSDQTKRNFEGKMMTNREILSKINELGGGVSFEQGGDIPKEMFYKGASYNFGGKTMTDYEIMKEISSCGCEDNYFNDGGEIQDLISKGIIELKMFDTKIEHAKEYGFDSKKPLYIQSLCITESQRLKGNGKKVLDYIDDYAIKNGHDLIFGHITQKAKFTKDSKNTDLCDIDLIKKFLRKGGYNIIKGNNDFYKIIKNNSKNTYINGGGVAKNMTLKDIAKKHKLTIRSIDNEVQLGLIAESEHTSDLEKQMEIIKDHLFENPKYYTKLKEAGLVEDKKFDANPFLNYYFDEIEEFLKNQNNIKLEDDFTFRYKGEKFLIHPILYVNITNEKIKEAHFIILDYEDENIGEIEFNANSTKKFRAVSNFFGWNNLNFMNGGKTQNLVKDAKSGNSPSRDLNNYNDLLDVSADGEVGGESGLTFVNGGDVTKPEVLKIRIKEARNLAPEIIDETATTLNEFYNILKKYAVNQLGQYAWVSFYVNQGTKGNFLIYFDNLKKRNSKKILNPYTFKEKDVQRIIENETIINDFYWTNFFNNVPPSTNAITSKVLKHADFRKKKIKVDFNKDLALKVIEKLEELGFYETREIKEKISQNDLPYGLYTLYDLVGDLQTESDFIADTYEEIFPSDLGIDVNNLGVAPTTATAPKVLTKDDVINSKIWIDDNSDLSERVSNKLLELGFKLARDNRLYTDETCIYTGVDGFFIVNQTKENFDNESEKEIFPSDLGIDVNNLGVAPTTTTAPKVLTKDDFKDKKIKVDYNKNLVSKIIEKLEELGFNDTIEIKEKISQNDLPYGLYTLKYYVGILQTESDFIADTYEEIYPSDLGIDVNNLGVAPTTTAPKVLTKDDVISSKIWIGGNSNLAVAVREKLISLGLSFDKNNSKALNDNEIYGIFTFSSDFLQKDYYDKKEFDENTSFREIFPSDLGIDVNNLGVAPTTTTAPKVLTKDDVNDSKIWIGGGNSNLVSAVKEKLISLGLNFDIKNSSQIKDSEVYYIFTYEGFNDFCVYGDNNKKDFDDYPKKEIFPSDLGIDVNNLGVAPTTATAPKVLTKKDFLGTKIKVDGNKDLALKVIEELEAFGIEDDLKIKKDIENNHVVPFAITIDEVGFISRWFYENDFIQLNSKEIFPSDLGIDVTTLGVAPTTTTSVNTKDFVADIKKLRFTDAIGLDKEKKDLNDFIKLLPSFQESKFSNEKSLILKQIKKLNDKLNNQLISDNELFNEIASHPTNDIFTPQGLLKYYYSQTTQSPIDKLEAPCELPTPNGLKSKLPLNAYLNVRTPQFKKWFGDWEKAYETNNYVNCSKLIDEETKEPKIFYHGVRKFVPNFGQFSNMGEGVTRPYGSFEPPSSFPASYFSDDEDYAKFYGGIAPNMPKPSADYQPFIYSVFLSSKNPLSLIPLGFDVSYKDVLDYLLVAYGIKKQPSRNVLNMINNDINKKHPIWVYLRNDVTMIETIKEYGYDSIVQIGDIPTFDSNGNVIEDRSQSIKEDEFLILSPTQIKSASVNKSFYFEFFKDIRFNKGGYVRL